MRDWRGITIVVCLLLFSSLSGFLDLTSQEASAYTMHSPISIDGDGNFLAVNGVTGGTGTASDPYIIEGWEIVTSYAGISISNTQAHFIIRDVYVHKDVSYYFGISFDNAANGRIYNVTVDDTEFGIKLYNSRNNSVSRNTLINADWAILLDGSHDNYISNNTFLGYSQVCILLGDSNNNSVTNNTISSHHKGVALERANYNIISHNTISYTSWNIITVDSIYNTFSYNSVFEAEWCIEVHDWDFAQSHNTFSHNEIFDCGWGLHIWGMHGGNISNNTVTNNSYGVIVDGSDRNDVYGNTFYDNWLGLQITQHADQNRIVRNDLASNSKGIRTEESDSNIIYHNNFIHNDDQASDYTGTNDWDNGYPSGGNYWSDYTGPDDCSGPFQDVCPDSDGIGDVAYITGVLDKYPLIGMVGSGDTDPPSVSITIPTDGQTFAATPITATGTASDLGGSGLQRVKVRLNYDIWTNAEGTSSWSTSLNLIPGSNVIEARAWDAAGNPSPIVSVTAIHILPENDPPDASFTVTPTSGNVTTTFTFNASSTSDPEDSASVLEIRWDWEDDGSWDTSWATSKVAQHQYTNPGTYAARLEVRDTGGLTDNTLKQVTVSPVPNMPPLCRIDTPSSGATVSGLSTIAGEASDSDGTVGIVEVEIDDGGWTQVSGTISWTYEWDTTTLTNGGHTIYARSYDGMDYSSVVSVTITIENAPQEEPEDIWLWIAVGVMIVVVVLLVFSLLGRRKKDSVREEPTHEPVEEDSEN